MADLAAAGAARCAGLAHRVRREVVVMDIAFGSIHSNIGSLVGIRLQDDFWLFANHESNRSNACHIGEFYLREISDRFRKAAFVADFKEKSYSWAQETIGGLYCIAPPKGYHPHTINYLFTIHVACTDFYLLEGYSRASNQPTFFKLEI